MMGGPQSSPSPSRSSSPTLVDESVRPLHSHRLSSFGNSKGPIGNRKPSHLVNISNYSPQEIMENARKTSEESMSGEEEEEEEESSMTEIEEEKISRTTPSAATSPGPPIGLCSPINPHPIPYPQPGVSSSRRDTTLSSPTSPGPPVELPLRPAHNRYLSLPNPASSSDRTLSGTLTAFLGFSGPDLDSTPTSDSTAIPSALEALAAAIEGSTTPNPEEVHVVDPDGADMEDPDGVLWEDGYGTGDGDSDADEDEDEFSTPAEPEIQGQGEGGNTAAIEEIDRELLGLGIDELQTRLDTAREELERSRAELDNLRDRRAARIDARNRVPVGAMLVIQGLAQTRITSTTIGEPSLVGESSSEPGLEGDAGPSTPASTSSPAARRPQYMTRRISDGSLFRRRRELDRERGASLDQQARMISGLLTVAAAATANTLLANPEPPTPASPPRSGLTGAIHTLLDRLRPSRTPQHGIEQALGQYLRNAVRDRRSSAATAARPGTDGVPQIPGLELPTVNVSEAQGGEEAGSEFHAFLQGLEGDLIGAVRAYAGSVRSEDWADELGAMRGEEGVREETAAEVAETAEAEVRSTGVSAMVEESGDREASVHEALPSRQAVSETVPGEPISEPTTTPTVSSGIPVFHRQLGQNVPSSSPADRYGVSGGQDGQPRQLNFFRAHLFPPISYGPTPAPSPSTSPPISGAEGLTGPTPAEGSTSASQIPAPDPNAIVPCIFVGVRSVQRDSEAENVFNQAAAPNAEDGVMNNLAAPSTSSPSIASTPSSSRPTLSRNSSSPAPPSTTPRTFRERFLSRISRRPALAPAHPVNTYIVYVIGGQYPANHPVLRIPALLSGEPLTDEDMALISELMGPAKATTATKEDIERAGLKLVDGSQMAELGKKGEVMDNCTERCLICLSDYEEGEECRILVCKHGYHKECVDQWLEKGSNSCPACRSEAVDVKHPGSTGIDTEDPMDRMFLEGMPPLSTPIPVLSVPAGGDDDLPAGYTHYEDIE